ncbi:hypothetical protein GCM10027020_11840 [Nocardioides salsibiostraticola]
MKSPALAAAFAATLLLTACGSDDPTAAAEDSSAASGSETPVAEVPETPRPEQEIDLDDDSLAVLDVYQILEGDTLRSDADPEHLAVFERFAEVIPPELRPEVTHFVAIDQEASDGTDGAMQHPADDDGIPVFEQTYIALDTTGPSAGATLDRTMVHEFGHLLTLRAGQITPLTDEEFESDAVIECEVYASPECPIEGSYLYDYFTQFEYDDDSEYFDDEYPTEYAATIPTEDVAEVFAEWVLDDGAPFTVTDGDVERDVEPGTVLEEKLEFFDAYPEVVEVREKMRAGLGVA